MKTTTFIMAFILCFSCKNEIQNHSQEVKSEVNNPEKPKYDFSTISKDTIVVSGKEIVFFLPSKEELEIIKTAQSNLKNDSLYRCQIQRIKAYLKFPENIKISTSTKRIIGVNDGRKIRYYDRLDYFKSNYGMLMMYNQTFNFSNGYKTERELYTIIDSYYRNNVTFEKTIAYKYVIAKNGLNLRDESGDVFGKYHYGDAVDIIGYTKDSVEIEDNNKLIKDVWAIVKWRENGLTKKGYVFNAYLGNRDEVKVLKDQICYGVTIENQYSYNGSGNQYLECLNSFFNFQLMSKDQYDSVLEMSTDFYKENSAVVITKNEDATTNVSLPLKDTLLVYNSKVDYSASSHSFYGDIDFLNQYLMFHVYYEAEEAFYAFIDKSTGKETFMFSGFPNISPNKDKIVAMHYDVYEGKSYFQVFKINSDKTVSFDKGFRFKFWTHNETSKIKWISNNEFLIAINFVNQKGVRDFETQYLKVKLKF